MCCFMTVLCRTMIRNLPGGLGHSHITPVAQLAAEAQVGRLVLIHLHACRPEMGEPELDRIQSIFPRTEVAFDRMEIEF